MRQLTLVNGLERSLLATVEASAEFNLGNGAGAEVTNAARAGGGGGTRGRSGRARRGSRRGGSGARARRAGRASADDTTLIIDFSNGRKVGRDAKAGVKGYKLLEDQEQ